MSSPTRIRLHHLTFVDEGDEVLVGRPDTESYAVLPADGAELLKQLQVSSVPEAVAWYEAEYSETPDVEGFLGDLRMLGFLHADDEAEPADQSQAPVRLRRLAKVLFSAPAWLLYAALLAAAVTYLVTDPQLRPTPTRIFFTGSLIVVPLVLAAVEIPLIWLHEMAHVLAGRRLGIASRIGIGHRLYFVVFQTTLTGIYSVPRRKRLLAFVAGMACDLVVFSVLILLAEADAAAHGTLTLPGRIAVASAYFAIIRFLWQFLFFLETDVQHVLATALRCTDLRGLTRTYLRSLVRRGAPKPVGTARELAVLRWFGPLTAVFVTVLIAGGAFSFSRIATEYVSRLSRGVGHGPDSARFWDSTASFLFVTGQLALVLTLTLRDRRRAARQPNEQKGLTP
ncbi:hypothetical protein ABIA35_006431 [Catenulispora sp. MAP12-49]|uniref:hypothetical protein n=1 Tax=unclassified Catenulispora TaxID=414885 RepID=UPI0035110FEB